MPSRKKKLKRSHSGELIDNDDNDDEGQQEEDLIMSDPSPDSLDNEAAAPASSGNSFTSAARNRLASIRRDLEQVESNYLSSPPSLLFHHSNNNNDNNRSGTAMFESVSSALTSIRSRLLTASGRAEEDDENDQQEEELRERLAAAERAHSSRMPLSIARQQLSASERGDSAGGGDASEASSRENSKQDDEDMSRDTSDQEEQQQRRRQEMMTMMSHTNDNKSAMKSGSRSTLVASRRVAEAAEEAATQARLHEGVGGVPLPHSSGGNKTRDDEDSELKDHDDEVVTPLLEASSLSMPEQDDDDSNKKHSTRNNRRRSSVMLSNAFAESLRFTASAATTENDVADETKMLTEEQDQEPLQPANTVYCWGENSTSKSISFHGSEKVTNDNPTPISADSRMGRSIIVSVSSSETHAACCTANGDCLVVGNNDKGILDPSNMQDAVIVKPRALELLSTTRILQVSCGENHTAAVTEARSVLTWGMNEFGQLGHRIVAVPNEGSSSSSAAIRRPAALYLTAGRRAASVACGNGFTVVLTTRMEVLSCGREEISGYDNCAYPELAPRLAKQHAALEGLPLVGIAAGNHHACAVTAHGTVYAWGRNSNGCCGREAPKLISVPVPINIPALKRGNDESRLFPNWCLVAATKNQQHPMYTLADEASIVHVACGEEHTVMVTKDGSLYVCGLNSQQQLGIAISTEEGETTMVTKSAVQVKHPSAQDDGRKFVAAECGDYSTLLLDDEGTVWQTYPPPPPMDDDSKSVLSPPLKPVLQGKNIVAIAAGGSQNVAIAALPGDESIVINPTYGDQLVKGLEDLIENKNLSNDKLQELANRTEELFRCPSIMNSLPLSPTYVQDLYSKLTVSLSQQSDDLSSESSQQQIQMISTSIENGMKRGLDAIQASARLLYPETMRVLFWYLQCPLFYKTLDNISFDSTGSLLQSLCDTILGLPFEGYKAFLKWATCLYGTKGPANFGDSEHDDFFETILVSPLVHKLNDYLKQGRTAHIPSIVGVLKWLHSASEKEGLVTPRQAFYCDSIETMPIEALYEDLERYKSAKQHKSRYGNVNFYICSNSFLMSPTAKRNLLQVEHQIEMVRAARASGVSYDAQRQEFLFQPYLVLTLDRQYLLPQTLQKIASAAPGDLRKSLKVVFKGEDGVDAGGVTREFFQLLGHQLFDLNTGMWAMNGTEDTWFNSVCTWNDDSYYLVGALCGLALYNNTILDVHFSHTVYRKLLGLPLGLEDMVDAEIRNGLQQLLDYEGDDVEDIFCLTYELTWMEFGMTRRHELKPGGADIPVTNDNKEDYVLRYVQWLLVDSIATQYDCFERGFYQVMGTSCLDLLRPEELELLLVGTPTLDFTALEQVCEYEGGYDKESAVIRNLWKFLQQDASSETQLQFMKFTTGTSRAPLGGLGSMSFKIQRAGPDSAALPTSHTCFNTLLLPDYGENYEKLKERLGRAVLECEGFGLQ